MGANSATFSEVIKECWQRKLKMAEQGWYSAPRTSFEMKDGQGEPYSTYAYSVNAAEVEVDIQTGEVRVSRLTAAHDVGKAVNPQTAEGQVEGGALQGLGYALCENLVYKDGIMVNPGFTDYVLPSTAEVPQFKTFIIEHPYEEGPYSAKGFGETPLIGVAPAVANAIRKAAGVRMNSLPMLPEKVWSMIKDERNDNKL